MKVLMLLLLVGSALAGTDQGVRDEFNGEAVDFFMGKDKMAAMLEMTPSPHCLEGDMEMSEEQKEVYSMMQEVTAENSARVRRYSSNAFRQWPDKTLVYQFDSSLSDEIKALFMAAVDEFTERTCIKFVEAKDGYTGDIRPIKVWGDGNGCSSTIGGPGGNLKLPDLCNSYGTILHELGHAIGALHEQSRSDRGDHVTINEENILPGYAHDFRVADRPLLAPYDLHSIMHYASTAYSKDGVSETIVPHVAKKSETMGLQKGLSRLDIYTFNLMYDCYEGCPEDLKDKCQHGGVPSKECTCICPEEYKGPYCEIFNAETACSVKLNATSGVIQSPGYPARYPIDTECVYAIECPVGMTVHLDFKDFDVEGYGCFFDFLETKTGGIIDEMYPDKYCDVALKGVNIQSKTNLALMKFKTDSRFNYMGFDVEYRCE
ncbi:dorsal-ventral patterning protein tolloid-like [Patiria miniata]|uniref:Metalloendopeptidase n=1 Tax=Patiria miniata TaxID=46514 RepID=A0A913Z0L1_PATMI|nr:dorsal-ventral patterning protein tolloid-like [Patiria miniata]